ncbi:hypothetical protein GCM10011497_27080 [Elstera cyanobacteriorum]|nr:hypothetical protein GCM10011497_27080 [Elstera cyanobacteriorum]
MRSATSAKATQATSAATMGSAEIAPKASQSRPRIPSADADVIIVRPIVRKYRNPYRQTMNIL